MRLKITLNVVLSIPFFFLIFLSNIAKAEKINLYQNENLSKYIDNIEPPCFKQDNYSKEQNYIEPILEITIPESRKWYKNLFRAKITKSWNITKNYKKRFKSNILVKNNKNESCILPSRVRISGDWKDHIVINKDHIISSMDIHLERGHINGFVKFKLFIPKTRNGNSEVLTTLILNELNQLSPRTKLVKVKVNGYEADMIMQEKPRKEFIEKNFKRESALIGVDESVMWNLRAYEKGLFRPLIFSRVINHKWTEKNQNTLKITLNGMKILSSAIIENFNHDLDLIRGGENSFSDKLLANNVEKSEEKLSLFRAYVLSMGAYHALTNHNRRFYYDPFINSLLPIYYDGNAKINKNWKLKNNNEFKEVKSSNFLRELSILDIDLAIKKVKEIDLLALEKKIFSAGLKLKEGDLEKIINNILSNLDFLKLHISEDMDLFLKKSTNTQYIYPNLNFKYGLAFTSDGRIFYLCENNYFKCNRVSLTKNSAINIFKGEYRKNDKLFYFAGDEYQSFLNGKFKMNNEVKNKIIIQDNFEIIKLGNPEIILNKLKKTITINALNLEDKVVINKSLIDAWSIYVKGPKSIKSNIFKERSDLNLLTSLLTIQDSILKNVNIKVEGGALEDSLNLIRSKGSINKIEVYNSFQDAIDFDFSNLEINEIIVDNSGNDCLDLSFGNYKVKKLIAINCADKGLSAGENSLVEIENVNLNTVQSGLIVKDSSKLKINNANIENYKICIAAYRKKQEFNGAFIIIPKNSCSKKSIFIQTKSKLIEK